MTSSPKSSISPRKSAKETAAVSLPAIATEDRPITTNTTAASPTLGPNPGLARLMPIFLFSLFSGLISLGYQVMWFRIYSDRFGSTNLTFLMVLVCFIGGLGLGAMLSQQILNLLSRLTRLKSDLAVVGVIEILIAAFALLTFLIDPSTLRSGGAFPYELDSRNIFEPIASLRLITVFAAASILLPTILMGTTFPILCSLFRNRSVFPSELYAWNTLGACSAVIVSEFFLLPVLGHAVAFQFLVGANVLLGVAFMMLARSFESDSVATVNQAADKPVPKSPKSQRSQAKGGSALNPRQWIVLHPSVIFIAAGLSGFVAGAIEVDMFRAVRFAGAITDAAMSFTSFWAILAIFLASWTVRALGRPRLWIIRFSIAASLIAYAATWFFLHDIRAWFNATYMAAVQSSPLMNPAVLEMTIYPFSASLLLVLGFTGVIVFPAYYLISLLLPTVCNMVQGGQQHLGRVYGLNTLAFCLGAVMFTYVFPGVSLFFAVKLLFVFIIAAAGLALTIRPGQPLHRFAIGGVAVVLIIGGLLVPKGFDASFFPKEELPSQFPVRAMKSNALHTTFVVEHFTGDFLFFDSYPMSGNSLEAQRYMRLMAHMPLLAQEDPSRALLICFGVGNTAAAIAAHETIDTIDIVDLNDKVFETAAEFKVTNGGVYADPRVKLIHDDGRGFMKRTDQKYDLITSEPPPPRDAGVYRLYSREYYEAVLAHLTPNGMMTQWLPINILSGTATNMMIATFAEVFPHSMLFVGSGDQLLLMGGREPFDPVMLERRFNASPRVKADLRGISINDPVQLLARIMRIDADLKGDVAKFSVISDTRNDLALAVSDPFDPPVIPVDPTAVFRQLDRDSLRSKENLRIVMKDAASLRVVVPDFPF